MVTNQLSRYGAIATVIPNLGPQGKMFIVAPSAEAYFGDLGNTFSADTDGVNRLFGSIQGAVNTSVGGRGDVVVVCPGAYDETVTVAFANDYLTIVGLGGRGAAYIDPSTEDAAGMLVHANDVTLINLGVAAEDETSAAALTVTGSRFRANGCKFEGGAKQVVVGPGTDAQVTAGTRGRGGDMIFEDCEFAWGTKGLVLQGTDFGAATQIQVLRCHFHNLTASSIDEAVGSGGTAAVTFFNFKALDCDFDGAEDGTMPTKFIDLDGNNANTGIVARCSFPLATNATGKNTVSTKVIWVSNYFVNGVSAAQPS